MDNNSCRQEYLNSILDRETMKDTAIRAIEDTWSRIGRVEAQIGKTLEEGYTKEEYISLFGSLNVMTASFMTVIKSTVMRYVKWAVEQGVMKEDAAKTLRSISFKDINSSGVLEKKYFSSLKDLKDAISMTLADSDRIDDGIFDTAIVSLYLAWYGLTIDEAIHVRMNEVRENRIETAGKVIRPDKDVMRFINDYKYAVFRYSRGNGLITRKYMNGEWLLRNFSSDCIKTPRYLRTMIGKFGAQSKTSQILFNYDKIYWAGIFYRAHIYETEHGEIKSGDVALIESVFKEKYNMTALANRRLQEYRKYRDYYFGTSGNEI